MVKCGIAAFNKYVWKLLTRHQKYNQSKYLKVIISSTRWNCTETAHSALRIMHCAYVALIVVATAFFIAWYKIDLQYFLMVYHGISHLSLGISHLSLVSSSYPLLPKVQVYTKKIKASVYYQENTSDL